MATKKKSYKGKYPGPDKYKGDPKKLAVYRAAKRKAAKKPALKPAAKPAVKPAAPAAAKPATVPNPGAVSSNSSGNIQLQTNAEIEAQALEAHEQLRQENERAAQMDAQALIQEQLGQKQSRDTFQENRSRSNQIMASRGMRGSAALHASAMDTKGYQTALEGVNTQKQGSITEANNIRTTASNWLKTRQGQLTLARKEYTDEQSKLNPTTGSTPINSGIKPTVPYKAPVKPAAKKPVAKPVAAKKFKGKYPGPDKFKGNMKLVNAYNAARRKAGKK